MSRLVIWAASLLLSAVANGNTPPRAPVIIEPAAGSTRAIDPGDVHMATSAFVDNDRDDALSCSDWEIRTLSGEVVWQAGCVTGVLAVHIHLGDGSFTTKEGRLQPETRYEVRVRFRDSSGDPATEWSDWSRRELVTSVAEGIRPLHMIDVLSSPPPRVLDANGSPAATPDGVAISVQSENGNVLVSFNKTGGQVIINNPPSLGVHASVNVTMSVSGQPVTVPAMKIELADQDANLHTIYLPQTSLKPADPALFWISEDGSSFDTPGFATLEREADLPWTVTEPGYRVERVLGGLQLPVNIVFVPKPRPEEDAPLYYVTELYGTIRVVLRNGTSREYVSGLLNFDPTGVFPGSGEQGIVGTAVDPDNGNLFVAVVYDNFGLHNQKVVRIQSIDGGRTAFLVTTILDMAGEEVGPSHQISSLSIGPDGMLYVHVGDGFQTDLARSLETYRGKILRVDRTGGAPVTNPFYSMTDGITPADYVFAYGFRNPFGGAWRERDRSLYEVENGPDVDRLAKVIPGGDYRWSGSDEDMYAGAAYNWYPSVAPVNIAFVQEGTQGGSGFPASKLDHAFVSESGSTWLAGRTPSGKRIREFAFADDGSVTATAPFVEYVGTGHATVAAVAAGPDGLYFSDLYPEQGSPIDHDAHVYRVRYVGRAAIGADVSDFATRTVRFAATVEVPRVRGLLWDFGDGATSTDSSPEHAYSGPGPYDVRLSVDSGPGTVIESYTRVQFPELPLRGLIATYSSLHGEELSRIDPNVDFDWDRVPPPLGESQFAARWLGEITPAVSGLYTFELRGGVSGVLRVDGLTIIDSKSPSVNVAAKPIRLEAGQRYSFLLEIDTNGEQGATQLLWSAEGMPSRVVPPNVFTPGIVRRRAVSH